MIIIATEREECFGMKSFFFFGKFIHKNSVQLKLKHWMENFFAEIRPFPE